MNGLHRRELPNQWLQAWGRADDGDGSALDVPLRTTLLRNYAHELGIFELQSAMFFPVWSHTLTSKSG